MFLKKRIISKFISSLILCGTVVTHFGSMSALNSDENLSKFSKSFEESISSLRGEVDENLIKSSIEIMNSANDSTEFVESLNLLKDEIFSYNERGTKKLAQIISIYKTLAEAVTLKKTNLNGLKNVIDHTHKDKKINLGEELFQELKKNIKNSIDSNYGLINCPFVQMMFAKMRSVNARNVKTNYVKIVYQI